MLEKIYMNAVNENLSARLVDYLKSNFVHAELSVYKDYRKMIKSLRKAGKTLLFIEKRVLVNQRISIREFNDELSEFDAKAVLVVSSQKELQHYNIFDYSQIDLIVTRDFDENSLLSGLKLVYGSVPVSQNCDRSSLHDIINLNSNKIKYRINLVDAINNTNEGIWLWDIKRNQVYLSPLFRKSLGYSYRHLPDDMARFTKLIHPEDKKAFRLTIMDYLQKKNGRFSVELRLRCYGRKYNWFLFRGYAIWNEKGVPEMMLIFQLNIHKTRVRMELLENMALYDSLTNLANRNLLYDIISREMSRCQRNRRKMGLLYIDLDKFKDVNDNFGHKVGDAVLKITARLLLRSVRKIDTVARLHGDEFIVVLPSLNTAKDITNFSQRIHKSLSTPMLIEGKTINITCSIGTSIYPRDGETIEALLEKADLSMYKRKNIYQTLFDVDKEKSL